MRTTHRVIGELLGGRKDGLEMGDINIVRVVSRLCKDPVAVPEAGR